MSNKKGTVGLTIIPSGHMSIAWDTNTLLECEKLGINHSAYISAWRKK